MRNSASFLTRIFHGGMVRTACQLMRIMVWLAHHRQQPDGPATPPCSNLCSKCSESLGIFQPRAGYSRSSGPNTYFMNVDHNQQKWPIRSGPCVFLESQGGLKKNPIAFYGTLLDPIELDGISGDMSSEIFERFYFTPYLRMLEFLKISSFRYLHTR